jgi:hypothetical protein
LSLGWLSKILTPQPQIQIPVRGNSELDISHVLNVNKIIGLGADVLQYYSITAAIANYVSKTKDVN